MQIRMSSIYQNSALSMEKELALACELAELLSCALNVSGDLIKQPFSSNGDKLLSLFNQTQQPLSGNLIVPSMLLVEAVQKDSSNLQEMGAQSFSSPMSARRDQIKDMPMKLLLNLGNSVMKMVDTKLDAAVISLVQEQQYKTTVSDEPTIQANSLRQLVSTSNPVVPTNLVTNFRATTDAALAQGNNLVAPVELESVVDLQVLGKLQSIQLTTSGSLSIVFQELNDNALQPVVQIAQLRLDTDRFLKSLEEKVQQIVDKAVASVREAAPKTHLTTNNQKQQEDSQPDQHQQQAMSEHTSNLQLHASIPPSLYGTSAMSSNITNFLDGIQMNAEALRAFAGMASRPSITIQQPYSLEPLPIQHIRNNTQENQSNANQMDCLKLLSASRNGGGGMKRESHNSKTSTTHTTAKRMKQDDTDIVQKEDLQDPFLNQSEGAEKQAFV